MEILPFSEVKAHLSEIADRTEVERDRVLVTRNGRPSFVLVNPEDLDSLEAAAGIAADARILESIRQSVGEAESGQRLPF